MKLGSRIRRLRNGLSLSQEELAQRVFVTRQSISNWENDRTYPDIESLLRLSEVFSVSLDILVKGDVAQMKREIVARELAAFQKDSAILAALFVGLLVLPVPLALLWRWLGMAAYLLLFSTAMVYAVRIERVKKKADIQTYREIVAFTEGKSLSEIERARESGKRPYQKALLVAAAMLLGLAVSMLLFYALKGII